ncbi:hypothetical protein F5876DRAFT_70700 [Lentinula aff. lateritia]|uniref:Uncharacterized protein n=1 Tax=Lentinula aff. lateritia TaxID=2804960 RepID=A0ACC1TID5_9AGAR|nr:hypothetical protein F5876DRAFT_70700 [Lentinula aff. lateritia]
MINKGKGEQRAEVISGDPNDNDDGGDSDNNDDEEGGEKAPCERCWMKKIPCLEQAGKQSTMICKPCHDAKVKCSYSGRPVAVKKEGGPSAIETRLAMADPATPAFLQMVSKGLRMLKRRRIVEQSEEEEVIEEQEVGKEGEEEEENEEEEAPVPKKAKIAASGKGKDKEIEE